MMGRNPKLPGSQTPLCDFSQPREYPVCCLEEEFPMTMQIGMVGTDGIILASDTKWMDSRENVRHTFSNSKIKLEDFGNGRGIAVSFARNMETSGRMANQIMAKFKDEDWRDPITPIETIAANVLKTAGDSNDAHCLIVLSSAVYGLRLFFLEVA